MLRQWTLNDVNLEMAPFIISRDTQNGGLLESEIATIVVAVSIVVIVTVIIVSFISCIVRRRKTRKYEQAPNPTQYPTGPEQARQKLPGLSRTNHEEIQRQAIISKSLAARHPARPLHRLSLVNEEEEERNEMKRKSNGLRKGWKDWEASMRGDRSVLLDSHPGIDAENEPLGHPATNSRSRTDSPPPRYAVGP